MDRPTATGKGRVEAVLGKEQVSLKDLGELIASTENGMDYEVRCGGRKLKGVKVELCFHTGCSSAHCDRKNGRHASGRPRA